MFKKSLLLITLAVVVLSCASVHSESKLQAVTLSENIFDLPKETRWPNLDVANGFIGLTTDYAPQNRFHLFDSTGREIFTKKPGYDHKIYVVNMRDCDSVILIGEVIFEFDALYSAYDYTGEIILQPFATMSVVKPSPSMKYFYTRNDFGEGTGAPVVFDSQGNLLAILRAKTGAWELTTINDSMLLFQNWNHLQILSIPSMTVIKEFTVEGILSPSFVLFSSISEDGNYYAFTGRSKTTVCNLTTGEVCFAEIPETHLRNSRFAISPHGECIIYYGCTGVLISIYCRDGQHYKAVVDSIWAPLDGPIAERHHLPFFYGDYCVFNYFTRTKIGAEYKSFIFNYRDLPEGPSKGITFNGYVSKAGSEENIQFHLLKTRSAQRSTASFTTFKLVGAEDE